MQELRTRCEPGLQAGTAVGFGAEDLAHTATFACKSQEGKHGRQQQNPFAVADGANRYDVATRISHPATWHTSPAGIKQTSSSGARSSPTARHSFWLPTVGSTYAPSSCALERPFSAAMPLNLAVPPATLCALSLVAPAASCTLAAVSHCGLKARPLAVCAQPDRVQMFTSYALQAHLSHMAKSSCLLDLPAAI
jgi:hypothetical protein